VFLGVREIGISFGSVGLVFLGVREVGRPFGSVGLVFLGVREVGRPFGPVGLVFLGVCEVGRPFGSVLTFMILRILSKINLSAIFCRVFKSPPSIRLSKRKVNPLTRSFSSSLTSNILATAFLIYNVGFRVG
jgi:hypothetical protein